MKKTIIKINIMLLIFVLMIGLMSVKVFAANPEITTELNFTNGSITDNSGDGWTWNPETKILVIDGLNLNATSGDALTLPDNSTIQVNSESNIQTQSNAYGIKCLGKLTITGNNKLTVNVNGTKQVINTNGELNINDAQIVSTTTGIYSNGGINISKSNIDILSSVSGINTNNANANILIENSKIKLISSKFDTNIQYYGISTGGGDATTCGNITLKNVDATIKYLFALYARSSNANNSGSALTIDGGTLNITGNGPTSNYGDLTIKNKAKVTVTTKGELWALHAYNGNINIIENSNVKISGTGHGIFTNGSNTSDVNITDSTVKVLLPDSIIGLTSANNATFTNSDVRIIATNQSAFDSTYVPGTLKINGGTAAFKASSGAYAAYDLYAGTRIATNGAKIYTAHSSAWFINDDLIFYPSSIIDNSTADIENFNNMYIYGNVTLSQDMTIDENVQLVVVAGGTLKISEGTKITNNGVLATGRSDSTGKTSNIINDGIIINNNSMVISALSVSPYTTCNLTNKGTVYNNGTISNKGTIQNNKSIINVNDSIIENVGQYAKYTGNEAILNITNQLDFSKTQIQEKYNNPNGALYWNNNTLTIKNVIVDANIILPEGCYITVQTGDNVTINGDISVKNGNAGNVTFKGKNLTVGGRIDGGNGSITIDGTTVNADNISATNNTSKLTLKNKAYLKVTNGCYLGASGSTSGEIIIEGASTLESCGDYATVGTGKFTITDKESKIIVRVLSGVTAISSGNEDAYEGLKLQDGIHFGKIDANTYTVLDKNNNIVNEILLTKMTYSIIASTNEGGTINNIGTTSDLIDEDKEYNITVNEGYVIKNVKIDGKDKGLITSYKFENINANHTIEVEFKKIEYTVNVEVGEGGKISTDSNFIVQYGENITINIATDDGYKLNLVTINGQKYETTDSKIILNTIKENIKIEVNFEKIDIKHENDDDNDDTEKDNDNKDNDASNNDDIVKTGDNIVNTAIFAIASTLVANIGLIIKRKNK